MVMVIDPDRIKSAQKLLFREKVFTLNRVVEILNCSRRTAQTKLKLWKAHTSYNQNGRYYALLQTPRFDRLGLWRHQDKFFSKHGNLKKTVVHLITTSDAGLSAHEIGLLVGLEPRSFMHHFRYAPGIRREKIGGVYVYFANEADKYSRQFQQRTPGGGLTEKPLGDDDVLAILTAIIRRHEISTDEIMSWPEIMSRNLSYQTVHEFLAAHGLLKKTPDTKL